MVLKRLLPAGTFRIDPQIANSIIFVPTSLVFCVSFFLDSFKEKKHVFLCPCCQTLEKSRGGVWQSTFSLMNCGAPEEGVRDLNNLSDATSRFNRLRRIEEFPSTQQKNQMGQINDLQHTTSKLCFCNSTTANSKNKFPFFSSLGF